MRKQQDSCRKRPAKALPLEPGSQFTSTWSRLKGVLRRITPQGMKDFYRLFVPRSMKEAFTDVYGCNVWSGGSGRDSTPENTAIYRGMLEEFLRTHEIKRVVDIGCGDWQFSKLIDWGDVDYIGIDTVPAVIEANQQRFGSRYTFVCRDVTQEALPPGDLVIIKDVLQHWPNEIIQAFLPRLDQYRYAILTNCGYPSPARNANIAMTGYRPLDLRLAPFYYPCEELLRYRTGHVPIGEWNKLVLLHQSRKQ